MLYVFRRQVVFIPRALTVRIPRVIAWRLMEWGWVHFVVNVEGDEIVYTPLNLSLEAIPTGQLRIYRLRRFTCSKMDRFGLTIPSDVAVTLGIDHGDLAEVRVHERAIVVRSLGLGASPVRSESLMKRRGKIRGSRYVSHSRVGAATGGVQKAGGGG